MKKKRKLKRPMLRYLRELTIVFVGVFFAFILNDFRNSQISKNEQREIYQMLYDDLERFSTAGNPNDSKSFIGTFRELKAVSDSLLQAGTIAPDLMIIGDYWHVELLGSLLNSGQLYGLNADIYTSTSRFYTVHQNLISLINAHNTYYENQLLPYAQEGMSAAMKPRLERLQLYQQNILMQAELCVEFANGLKRKIKENCLD